MNYLPYRDRESKTEPMNELEKEIYNNLVSHENITEGQNPLSALVCKGHSKVAAAIALKWIEDFRDWYDNPPAGSGCGIGLYNMSTTDLVEKFISHKSKVSNTKENP